MGRLSITRSCEVCGTEFHPQGQATGRFCNRPCMYIGKRPERDPITHFWEKVDKTPGQGPWGDCWIWTAANLDGYGIVRINGKNARAQRIAYQLHYNIVLTPNEWGLHKCDNPPCVNPDHIFIGDQLANMQDCRMKGRIRYGERHKNAKLTDAKVREILIDPRIYRLIGADYGVTRHIISLIKRGMLWKHVSNPTHPHGA